MPSAQGCVQARPNLRRAVVGSIGHRQEAVLGQLHCERCVAFRHQGPLTKARADAGNHRLDGSPGRSHSDFARGLLAGGDKSSQQQDIKTAISLAKGLWEQ